MVGIMNHFKMLKEIRVWRKWTLREGIISVSMI
jgi:hypothetical protein